ncbi:MAG: hypothetical protein ABR536_01410 [Solirubrobacterales bacterium]
MKRNPFRSEADAFRLLLLVGGAALLVLATALLAGPKIAAVAGVVLVFFGLFHATRWIKQAISQPEEQRVQK